jgi:uncharacterized damage-inducible protein DinB
MKTLLQFFADYNRKTNLELLAILDAQDPALLTRPTGAYYQSILGTLSHVLLTDIVWCTRLAAFDAALASSVGPAPASGPPEVVDRVWTGLGAFRTAREQVDRSFVGLTSAVSEQRLGETMHYKNLKGEPQAKPVWVVLLHLFNHQTHHRGQVATLLDQAGVANDYSGIVNKYA